jgi:sugar transferase EpsL
LKRAFDVFVAVAALVVLAPCMLMIAVLVRLAMGRPVLFRQLRPGLHGKPFAMIKFRTMLLDKSEGRNTMPDEARLTKVGQLLRSTSLDELPELWNILQGDMSLVGPRPLLMEYLPLYTSTQMRRHDVRPGITGWAQINGRNALSWEEKFALDLWYVENRSFWLDVRIILKTIVKVFAKEGINADGSATMPRFEGTGEE